MALSQSSHDSVASAAFIRRTCTRSAGVTASPLDPWVW